MLAKNIFLCNIVKICAEVAELVDAPDSKSGELARVGSSPTFGTKNHLQETQEG